MASRDPSANREHAFQFLIPRSKQDRIESARAAANARWHGKAPQRKGRRGDRHHMTQAHLRNCAECRRFARAFLALMQHEAWRDIEDSLEVG